jgi:endoglucanase
MMPGKMRFYMALRGFFLFCALALFASLPVSRASAQQVSDLHRGLNLSSWLANAPRQPVSARDFAQIKQAGFDHVRLPFNPSYYGFKLEESGGDVTHIDFTPLDRAVAMAEQYNLPVIIDLHPSGEFVDTLERYPWAETEYVALWKAIALRYRSHGASAVLFELLNEPQYYKAEARWTRLAERLTTTIRGVSPDRTIIIGAPHGSEIDGLAYLQPHTDLHTIYTFHFYEPYIVTHQGIHMGFEGKSIRAFRNLPYPSDLATKPASSYAPEASNAAQAQNELTDYINTPWDSTHVGARIKVAQDWATTNHVRILCGEFGALRNHIDPTSRYRWINDARIAMDADGIGWELWDYTDLFGIAVPVGATSTDPVDGSVRLNDPEKGSRTFEPAALKALGLAQGMTR